MRAFYILTVCWVFFWLTSCSGTDVESFSDVNQTCEPGQITTTEGVNAARRDIREVGFKIIRYDMPLARTGVWDSYDRRFEHFGIDEAHAPFASLEYCRAYNAEMDRALSQQYGAEYRKYRKKLLPAPNSVHYHSKPD